MKIKISLIALLLFTIPTIKAQVLWSDDFDSYPAGDLIADQTSTIPDQGGWYSGSSSPKTADALVTPETGKGNVLIVTPNSAAPGGGTISFRQAQGVIDALWNNRTANNNIMKFEYEFYGSGFFNVAGNIVSQGPGLINVVFQSNLDRIGANYWDTTSSKHIILKNYSTTVFPYDTWIKAEMFIDYNTNDVYFYLPALNILETRSFSHNRIPDGISFSIMGVNQSGVVKLDNIKLSALQTLPSHLVSVNKFVSSTFTIFPNPVTDIVTITNSENIGVEQIKVFDVSGKTVKLLNFNNENEVQLNIGDFAAGTYLLHIKTNEGTAIEKVVKK